MEITTYCCIQNQTEHCAVFNSVCVWCGAHIYMLSVTAQWSKRK